MVQKPDGRQKNDEFRMQQGLQAGLPEVLEGKTREICFYNDRIFHQVTFTSRDDLNNSDNKTKKVRLKENPF